MGYDKAHLFQAIQSRYRRLNALLLYMRNSNPNGSPNLLSAKDKKPQRSIVPLPERPSNPTAAQTRVGEVAKNAKDGNLRSSKEEDLVLAILDVMDKTERSCDRCRSLIGNGEYRSASTLFVDVAAIYFKLSTSLSYMHETYKTEE